MFTGIIEELGQVVSITGDDASAKITLRGPEVTSDATIGASIAVNGVCLTVTELDGDTFAADVMAETLHRTALGGLSEGDPVNLERAMAANGRFGGHIVQGHVDTTVTVRERSPGENWEVVTLDLPEDVAPYIVEKGSVTLDGTSLTVANVGDGWFTVSLIPATLAATTLGTRKVGERFNLEVDIMAKHIERLLQSQSQSVSRGRHAAGTADSTPDPKETN